MTSKRTYDDLSLEEQSNLLKEFKRNPHPTKHQLLMIANEFGMSLEALSIWYAKQASGDIIEEMEKYGDGIWITETDRNSKKKSKSPKTPRIPKKLQTPKTISDLTNAELAKLRSHFETKSYTTKIRLAKLAKDVGLTVEQVQQWGKDNESRGKAVQKTVKWGYKQLAIHPPSKMEELTPAEIDNVCEEIKTLPKNPSEEDLIMFARRLRLDRESFLSAYRAVRAMNGNPQEYPTQDSIERSLKRKRVDYNEPGPFNVTQDSGNYDSDEESDLVNQFLKLRSLFIQVIEQYEEKRLDAVIDGDEKAIRSVLKELEDDNLQLEASLQKAEDKKTKAISDFERTSIQASMRSNYHEEEKAKSLKLEKTLKALQDELEDAGNQLMRICPQARSLEWDVPDTERQIVQTENLLEIATLQSEEPSAENTRRIQDLVLAKNQKVESLKLKVRNNKDRIDVLDAALNENIECFPNVIAKLAEEENELKIRKIENQGFKSTLQNLRNELNYWQKKNVNISNFTNTESTAELKQSYERAASEKDQLEAEMKDLSAENRKLKREMALLKRQLGCDSENEHSDDDFSN